jgi:hypothetical protein
MRWAIQPTLNRPEKIQKICLFRKKKSKINKLQKVAKTSFFVRLKQNIGGLKIVHFWAFKVR